jgi:protein-S-isoprenylcysteine O-methyltransferase Ste14
MKKSAAAVENRGARDNRPVFDVLAAATRRKSRTTWAEYSCGRDFPGAACARPTISDDVLTSCAGCRYKHRLTGVRFARGSELLSACSRIASWSQGMPPMPSTPSAANTISADRPGSKLPHSVAEFLIRRRILISAILFGLLIGYSVAYGPKPHDLVDYRDPLSILGGLLVVVGLALRSWAAGILRKNAELATTGPYALIRNPLYAGSFLMMFGFCTLIGNPLSFAIILGPVLVIYIVKVRHEEILLSSRFSHQWAEYARRTPRFLPRLRRVDLKADWHFSQWLRHREYQALVASLVALAAIEVWHSM